MSEILTRKEYDAHNRIGENGRTGEIDGAEYVLTLPAGKTNDLVTIGMLETLEVARRARWADIEVRIDGEWRRFEADWLRYLQVTKVPAPKDTSDGA